MFSLMMAMMPPDSSAAGLAAEALSPGAAAVPSPAGFGAVGFFLAAAAFSLSALSRSISAFTGLTPLPSSLVVGVGTSVTAPDLAVRLAMVIAFWRWSICLSRLG